MRSPHCRTPSVLAVALAFVAALCPPPAARAQGITTGDLNGDGVQGNDLPYVPRNALDPTEIQYRAVGARTPAQQA